MTDFFRVKESFQRQRVMHTLGMELLDVKAGECIIGFSYREDLTQQNGFIHAGVIATALDSACGYAAFSMLAALLHRQADGDGARVETEKFQEGRCGCPLH